MVTKQEQHRRWPGNETGQTATLSLAGSWLHIFKLPKLPTSHREDKHADLLLNGMFMSLLWKVTPKVSSTPKNQTLQKWFPPFVNWSHCLFLFLCLLFFCSPLSTPTNKIGLLNNYLLRGNLLSKYFWNIINFYRQWEETIHTHLLLGMVLALSGDSQVPCNDCVSGAYVNKTSINFRTTGRLNCWISLD